MTFAEDKLLLINRANIVLDILGLAFKGVASSNYIASEMGGELEKFLKEQVRCGLLRDFRTISAIDSQGVYWWFEPNGNQVWDTKGKCCEFLVTKDATIKSEGVKP